MSSIDKLALTCSVLYDQRVLEQRKEIEMLKLKLFFRDYTPKVMRRAMKHLNQVNIRCKCSGCKLTGRMFIGDTEDKEAACTFGPWLDIVLSERGLVTLRKQVHEDKNFTGPYLDEIGTKSVEFTLDFDFSDEDCHLVEMPDQSIPQTVDSHPRWENVYIGRRLWDVKSVNNQGIIQFERVFGNDSKRLSSPPTPPPSPVRH